jgi:hypothetical protein
MAQTSEKKCFIKIFHNWRYNVEVSKERKKRDMFEKSKKYFHISLYWI